MTIDDRVAAWNHGTATDSQTGKKLEFRGIVIWRIAARQIVERWARRTRPAESVTATRISGGAIIAPHLPS